MLKQLEHDLKTGRLSRRDFLKAASMFGLATAAPGILMGTAYAADAPVKGGHFKIGSPHGSTTDSLDSGSWSHGFVQSMARAFNGYLTNIQAGNKLVGELAESWEASPDAKVWTFKLRKGVEYHNGQSMVAEDVVASMNYHRGEKTQSAAKALLITVEDIKADGDNVIFTLSEGNADLPYLLSDYHLVIQPRDEQGNLMKESTIGAGAYTLKSHEPGVKVELVKFKNFWNDQEGHVESAELLSIIDTAARTNALTTGEVDIIDRLDTKTIHLLRRNKNIKIMETSGNAHYSMPMRCDTDPYTNNDIRLAIKYCLDREALLKNVLRGHGYLGNDHPIGRANRYLSADIEQRAYDPDKAKYHLKKAGAEGLKVQLSAADAAFAGAVDAAVLFKEHASKAGINVEVVREPNDGYWSNVWMKKPFAMCYWGGRATEDWMFSSAYAEDAKWNDSFWKHERFNKLLVEARAELDESKRGEIYADMQKIVHNDGGVPIPMFNNFIFASTTDVMQPAEMSNEWEMDGNRAIQRWWKTS